MGDYIVSYETEKEAERLLEVDKDARDIVNIEEQLKAKKLEIAQLEATSVHLKTERTNSYKKLREPVIRCVEIDAHNMRYFLKHAAGVYNCVAFIAKIELTTEVKQKITITLSSLFKEKRIGRTTYRDQYYYGIIDFFEQDEYGLFSILKNEYATKLDQLKT